MPQDGNARALPVSAAPADPPLLPESQSALTAPGAARWDDGATAVELLSQAVERGAQVHRVVRLPVLHEHHQQLRPQPRGYEVVLWRLISPKTTAKGWANAISCGIQPVLDCAPRNHRFETALNPWLTRCVRSDACRRLLHRLPPPPPPSHPPRALKPRVARRRPRALREASERPHGITAWRSRAPAWMTAPVRTGEHPPRRSGKRFLPPPSHACARGAAAGWRDAPPPRCCTAIWRSCVPWRAWFAPSPLRPLPRPRCWKDRPAAYPRAGAPAATAACPAAGLLVPPPPRPTWEEQRELAWPSPEERPMSRHRQLAKVPASRWCGRGAVGVR
jgi:hypothetical protein